MNRLLATLLLCVLSTAMPALAQTANAKPPQVDAWIGRYKARLIDVDVSVWDDAKTPIFRIECGPDTDPGKAGKDDNPDCARWTAIREPDLGVNHMTLSRIPNDKSVRISSGEIQCLGGDFFLICKATPGATLTSRDGEKRLVGRTGLFGWWMPDGQIEFTKLD